MPVHNDVNQGHSGHMAHARQQGINDREINTSNTTQSQASSSTCDVTYFRRPGWLYFAASSLSYQLIDATCHTMQAIKLLFFSRGNSITTQTTASAPIAVVRRKSQKAAPAPSKSDIKTEEPVVSKKKKQKKKHLSEVAEKTSSDDEALDLSMLVKHKNIHKPFKKEKQHKETKTSQALPVEKTGMQQVNIEPTQSNCYFFLPVQQSKSIHNKDRLPFLLKIEISQLFCYENLDAVLKNLIEISKYYTLLDNYKEYEYHCHCATFLFKCNENKDKTPCKFKNFTTHELMSMVQIHINLLIELCGIKGFNLSNIKTLNLSDVKVIIDSRKDSSTINCKNICSILRLCRNYYFALDKKDEAALMEKLLRDIFPMAKTNVDFKYDLSRRKNFTITNESELYYDIRFLGRIMAAKDINAVTQEKERIESFCHPILNKMKNRYVAASHCQNLAYSYRSMFNPTNETEDNKHLQIMGKGLPLIQLGLDFFFGNDRVPLERFALSQFDISPITEQRNILSALLSAAAHLYSDLSILSKTDAIKNKKYARALRSYANNLKPSRLKK